MKIIIFAGGRGTRLWPLSREDSPKQFDKIFAGHSTLELAINRLEQKFGIENIFVQTIEKYKNKIIEQIPNLPVENLLIEPARRNLGPAVFFALHTLKEQGVKGTVGILWADHLIKQPKKFTESLEAAKKIIAHKKDKIVFLGEQPLFANDNIGWIRIKGKLGNIDGRNYYEFAGWAYKPNPKKCTKLFSAGSALWNTGYFVADIDFLFKQFKRLAPQIYDFVIAGKYEDLKPVSFDRALIEKLEHSHAVVIKTKMGWSDPGTLYALKKALEKKADANVYSGEVVEMNTKDSLLYNMEEGKLLAVIGLDSFVVVNTDDVVFVAPKDEVVNITALIDYLHKKGKSKYV